MAEKFHTIDNFIVHAEGASARATDGQASYSGRADALTEKYLALQVENAQAKAELSGQDLKITFWQVESGLRLNKATLILAPITPTIPLSAFASLMCAALHKATVQKIKLEARVEQLETELDDMTTAKTEMQTDLLARFHSVLNSRIKNE